MRNGPCGPSDMKEAAQGATWKYKLLHALMMASSSRSCRQGPISTQSGRQNYTNEGHKTHIHNTTHHEVGGDRNVTLNLQHFLSCNGGWLIWCLVALQSDLQTTQERKCMKYSSWMAYSRRMMPVMYWSTNFCDVEGPGRGTSLSALVTCTQHSSASTCVLK